ncbi:hypothetical protein D3C83_86610 [compost metagenome]
MAFIELLHQRACLGQQQKRIVLRRDAELPQPLRPLVEHVAGTVNQAFTQGAVSDEQDAYHGGAGSSGSRAILRFCAATCTRRP